MATIEFPSYLIIFGLIFMVWLSIIYAWAVRKLAARMENRVGPPFNQPAFDIAKLMAKERIYPNGSIRWIMHWMPRVQVFVALLMMFFIPVTANGGFLSFDGDLYFLIFLLAIHGSTTFFVGWASRNPYALSGAGRAVMTEISLEIPLALSLGGMAIMTGSMRISEITARTWETIFLDNSGAFVFSVRILYLIPWLLLLFTTIYCAIGALELNPFSAAHAKTELVSGWNTELTGSDLALTKFADVVNLFNLSGLIAAVFLGGPVIFNENPDTIILQLLVILVAFLTYLLKVLLVLFFIALVATLSSTLRIDQVTQALWSYFLPISMVSILLIIIIQQFGG